MRSDQFQCFLLRMNECGREGREAKIIKKLKMRKEVRGRLVMALIKIKELDFLSSHHHHRHHHPPPACQPFLLPPSALLF